MAFPDLTGAASVRSFDSSAASIRRFGCRGAAGVGASRQAAIQFFPAAAFRAPAQAMGGDAPSAQVIRKIGRQGLYNVV